MSKTGSSELATVAALFKQSLQGMFDAWEDSRPPRTGAPHASTILQPEGDWCVRRQVLLALYPEEAKKPEPKPWDGKRNRINKHGWVIHEKYQGLLLRFGNVVYFNNDFDKPELDYSHFDEERYVWYSPDAIIDWATHHRVVEIKGYKQEVWDELDEDGLPPRDAWMQCNFYLHLLGLQYGFVLVENKNNQDPKIWGIEHDPILARPYTQRCYDVKGAVVVAAKHQKFPARVCKSCNDDRASKCPVRDFCFSRRLEER